MKRIYQILAALALVVSMQGCSKNSELDPESKIQLQLTGSISEVTRVNANGFEANDQVGVYVSSTSSLAESNNYFDNVKFTYADSKLTSTTPIYWPTRDSKLSVFAYYPYSESVPSVSEYPFSVAADQSIDGAFYTSDFIYAKETNIAPTGNEVGLVFNHMLSRINVSLGVDGESGIESGDLAADNTKVMQFVGLANEGVIDLNNGTATVNNSTTTITPMAAADGLTYSAVVYPQTNKLTFRLDFGGKVYALSQNVTLEPGHQYTYNLTVNVWDQPQLSLTNVSVGNWANGTGGNVTMSDFINIPDENFKAYLLQEKLYTEGYFDNPESLVSNGMIDANRDGQISIKEAEAVKMIHLYKGETAEEIEAADGRVGSLEGIEYFTNLVYLNCQGNELTEVDLSHNTKLKDLNLMFNKLTALDISKNTALKDLICDYNQLTSLDVSNNTALTLLMCEYNELTALDVSKNIALTDLYCRINQLTSLDVSNNTKLKRLWCYSNQIKQLDLSKNTLLGSLDCASNQLTTLDVSNNKELQHIGCGYNQLTSLDVSQNTELVILGCDENQLSSLDVSQNTKLVELNCRNNQLTSLDISTNLTLNIFLCNPMNDASGNNLLEKIYMAEEQDIEGFDEFEKPEATTIERKTN